MKFLGVGGCFTCSSFFKYQTLKPPLILSIRVTVMLYWIYREKNRCDYNTTIFNLRGSGQKKKEKSVRQTLIYKQCLNWRVAQKNETSQLILFFCFFAHFYYFIILERQIAADILQSSMLFSVKFALLCEFIIIY